jgi:Lrp/AsnC family leucine-responsive transcriptional regulator
LRSGLLSVEACAMKTRGNLDWYDKSILRLLAKQGRMSWRDLCDAISLSLTPTLRRVRILESSGYILGYSARLNKALLFGSIEAYATIGLERQSEEAAAIFEREIATIKEVVSCSQTAGNVDYILQIRAHDLDHYRATIARVTQISAVVQVHSNFILKTVEKDVVEIL